MAPEESVAISPSSKAMILARPRLEPFHINEYNETRDEMNVARIHMVGGRLGGGTARLFEEIAAESCLSCSITG